MYATFLSLYRVLLWCALFFVSLVDCFVALEHPTGGWSQVAVVFFVFSACASSFILASNIANSQVINTRIYQLFRNASVTPSAVVSSSSSASASSLPDTPPRGFQSPPAALHQQQQQGGNGMREAAPRPDSSSLKSIRASIAMTLYISVFFSMFVSALGAAADFIDSDSYRNDETSPVFLRLGAGGIFFYRVSAVLVQLQCTVGIALFSALVRILRIRAHAVHRLLTVGEETTPVAQALRRFIDLDITISHASHKATGNVVTIFLGFFLKFILSALFHVTENVKERFVSRTQFGPAQIIDMVIQPGMICIFILMCVGTLNQEIDTLIHVSARYALRQRSKPRHDRKLIKEFQTYVKHGDFYFRLYGFTAFLSTVWKFIAVSFSAYILLLRFKRWGIL